MEHLICHATVERQLQISSVEPQQRDEDSAAGSIQLPPGHDAQEAIIHLKKTMQDEMLANPGRDFYVQINDNNLARYWVQP